MGKKKGGGGERKKEKENKCNVGEVERLQEDSVCVSPQCCTCGTFVTGQTDTRGRTSQTLPA